MVYNSLLLASFYLAVSGSSLLKVANPDCWGHGESVDTRSYHSIIKNRFEIVRRLGDSKFHKKCIIFLCHTCKSPSGQGSQCGHWWNWWRKQSRSRKVESGWSHLDFQTRSKLISICSAYVLFLIDILRQRSLKDFCTLIWIKTLPPNLKAPTVPTVPTPHFSFFFV